MYIVHICSYYEQGPRAILVSIHPCRFMMARGQQKIQSQQKNAAKQAKLKKGAGGDQKAAAKKALIYTCPVCRTQMPDPKTYRQHFESKHPKQPLPPELQGAGV